MAAIRQIVSWHGRAICHDRGMLAPSPPPPMLSVSHLKSGYGKKPVLHDVSLTVGAGEIVSLMGRNGMGKTTTVRTVMGLTRAWDGQIELKGKDVSRAAPEAISRGGIGYVPEGRGVFPNLSVQENLLMSARPGG